MQAVSYRLNGEAVRAKVSETVQRTLDVWCDEWFATLPTYTVRMDVEQPPSMEWRAAAFDQELWVACRLKDMAARDFMQLLLGQNTGIAHSPILTEVFDACIQDLLQCLLRAAAELEWSSVTTTASLEGLRVNAESGMLNAILGGALPIDAVAVGGAWVEAVAAGALPAPAPVLLSPRRAVVGKGEVRIELGLGKAELSLAELSGIAVGDVLMLDVRHQDALQLRNIEGSPICKAHLGRTGQHMAVQVFSK